MFILLSQIWLTLTPFAIFINAEGGEGAQAFDFTPLGVWRSMGTIARVVIIILFVMSIWSILTQANTTLTRRSLIRML